MTLQARFNSGLQGFIASPLQAFTGGLTGPPCVGIIEIVNQLETWIGYTPLTTIDTTSPCHLMVFMAGSVTPVSMLDAINRIRLYFGLLPWTDIPHTSCLDLCKWYRLGIGTVSKADRPSNWGKGKEDGRLDYFSPYPPAPPYGWPLLGNWVYGGATKTNQEIYSSAVSLTWPPHAPGAPPDYFLTIKQMQGLIRSKKDVRFRPTDDATQADSNMASIAGLETRSYEASRLSFMFGGIPDREGPVLPTPNINIGVISSELGGVQTVEAPLDFVIETVTPDYIGIGAVPPYQKIWKDVSNEYRQATYNWRVTTNFLGDPFFQAISFEQAYDIVIAEIGFDWQRVLLEATRTTDFYRVYPYTGLHCFVWRVKDDPAQETPP